MERWYMEFVDIEGMELFMSGYVVMVYDDRLYMRKDNIQALSAINRVKGIWRALVIENLAHGLECERILKISSVSFGSILPDDFNSIAFECVKKLVKELSCASEQSSSILSAKCDGNKRSTLFNNFPYIAVYFNNDDASDALSPSLRSFVILTSFAQDSWSATRLLSKVCPIILPALRRSAQESMGYLNIMSVLISYVMTSPVEDNDNTDIELRANFQMLKNFVDTVVVMNEMLQSNIQPNEAVKSALKMAVEFMITIPNYTNPSVMNKMIVYLNRNIEQLSTNFALINSTVMSNKYQTKTSSQTDAHVIAISVCDRLTRLNGIEGIGIVSPLFKSLKSIAVVSNPMIAVNQKVIAEQNRTSNVLEIRIASFMK